MLCCKYLVVLCVCNLHVFFFLFCPEPLRHSDWWWRLLQMHVTWGEELQILFRNAKMTATFLCSFQKRIKGKEWLTTRLKVVFSCLLWLSIPDQGCCGLKCVLLYCFHSMTHNNRHLTACRNHLKYMIISFPSSSIHSEKNTGHNCMYCCVSCVESIWCRVIVDAFSIPHWFNVSI